MLRVCEHAAWLSDARGPGESEARASLLGRLHQLPSAFDWASAPLIGFTLRLLELTRCQSRPLRELASFPTCRVATC